MKTTLQRLGLHHFAHLRAVAEGTTIAEAAARYLGVEHGHAARPLHRAIVEHLRSLARRRGDKAWRLVGLTIRLRDAPMRPSLDDFVIERDLEGWSESEVLELYREAWPLDAKTERRQRLRERQLVLLRELETVAAQAARPSDPIAAWFDPAMSDRLQRCGMLLLQDLQERIDQGGRWWTGIPAVGAVKAAGLRAHLAVLLPMPRSSGRPPFEMPATEVQQSTTSREFRFFAAPRLESSPLGVEVQVAARLTQARTDAQVIETWITAKSGSQATVLSYRRECRRLLLWLHHERGKSLGDLQVEDCIDYMTFLATIPSAWISRRQSSPLAQGWAPFRGPLSTNSRRQALIVLGSFFEWLTATGYLSGRNPWLLVNKRLGDERDRSMHESRAFTPEAWASILAYLDDQASQAHAPASLQRMRFILSFVEATGLRSTELVQSTLGAFRRHKGHWSMQVHGKGARNRVIAVPHQAIQALESYLVSRQLPPLGQASSTLPVLASTRDAALPITYATLYQTMKTWMLRAIRFADLDLLARTEAQRASPHWLRHTCGTRAVERGTPLDVVQQQFGHADPRTTARYSSAQLERVQELMNAAFGGLPE